MKCFIFLRENIDFLHIARKKVLCDKATNVLSREKLRLFLNSPLVLGTFIDRYLLDINEEITRQNSQSDGHPPVDIFSKQKGSC